MEDNNITVKRAKPVNPVSVLPIPKSAIKWLTVSLAVAISWHIPHVPMWAPVAALIMGSIAYWLLLKEKPLPSSFLKITLAAACVLGVIGTYHSYLGRDQGITTLVLFSSLKMMELKTRRDFMILVFLCYFLVFGNFLYDQSLIDLIFTLTATILITAALIRLNYPQPRNEKVKISFLLKFSLRLFLFTLPFTVLLFFIFPRSAVPLWNLSQGSLQRFQSGFSDVVNPGQIAESALSKLPAFQVEFPGNNMPAQRDLYFRGLVLWSTNGRQWSQGIMASRFARSLPMPGEGITQNITLYPHNRWWLFGLDRPEFFPPGSQVYPGFIFQTTWPVSSLYRYSVTSNLKPVDSAPLSGRMREWSLQLPDSRCRRTIELGRKWRNEASDDLAILRTAEAFFKNSNFVYTLRPGLMYLDDPFDDFLFNKRRGFCEHYAGAFTLLMRAAGVPARVIVGYQGGQFNSVGKYLLVSQSEAHAWSEVWLEGRGWLRVDPTGWVSPERLEYGLDVSESLLSLGNLSGLSREEAIRNALNQGIFKKIFNFFKLHWDNINYKWDVWIISYDKFRQLNFFKNLGFENVRGMELFLAVIIIVPLLFLIISTILKRQALKMDPLLRIYYAFCLKTEKAGLQRLRWEGPVHFQHRASQKFPQKAELLRQFTDLFVQLRYGQLEVTPPRLKELKRFVYKLHLKKLL